MAILHKTLAQGRWYTLTLAEQLGNIGGEVSRTRSAMGKDPARFDRAFERALELFDLTLADSRWHGRRREIARAREVFCDAIFGGIEYHTSLDSLVRYLDEFGYKAQYGN